MSKILVDKDVLEQALEAILNFPDDISDEMFESITALKAALAEPVQEPDPGEYHGWVLREVLFEKGEPVGHREPVQEPFCYVYEYDSPYGLHREFYPREYNGMKPSRTVPLYAAPPQRKPLTEEEMYIVEEEARKNFRLAQAGPRGQMITYWDSLTPWLIRAVERAHGIGE